MEERKCSACHSNDNGGQWYTGPQCKSCYRKILRQNNIEKFKERDKTSYEKRKDKVLEKAKEYYQKNSERIRSRTKAHREKVGEQRREGYLEEYWSISENKERRLIASLAWDRNNPEKAKLRHNNWNKRHPQYRAYMTARRRATKLQATPKWLTCEQNKEILDIYRSCPKGFHVDHIVPLNNPNVSGLHVPWNLQVIPAEENLRKSNKL